MSKHIPTREQPLHAPPHSGSSPGPVPPAGGQERGQSSTALSDDQIAVRAYEIWLERGKPEGAADAHWHEARHQLQAQVSDPQKDTTPLEPVR